MGVEPPSHVWFMKNKFDLSGLSKKALLQLLGTYQQAIDLNIICSITDLEGNIIYVNRKFCEVSKFSEKELLGQNHRIVNSDFHSKGFFENMWYTIGKGDVWQGEVKSKAKDGTYFWLHSVIIPILDDHKNIIQFFSLRFPIDEKKNAEDERVEFIKALEEMLFMTSHNVRKPISSFLGLMQLINCGNPLSEEALKLILEYAKSPALELDTFTHELTTFIYDVTERNKNKIIRLPGLN